MVMVGVSIAFLLGGLGWSVGWWFVLEVEADAEIEHFGSPFEFIEKILILSRAFAIHASLHLLSCFI